MKIYTRTGDDGATGLFGGGRVKKHHPRIEAYGTVDETNAVLAMALSAFKDEPGEESVAPLLTLLQADLFVLGADLATPSSARAKAPRIEAAHVAALEESIDKFQASLPPLKTFILPGGTLAASMLHLARTTCRRAERRAVAAMEQEDLSPHALIYLNRLSDLLFVLARWANHASGIAETPWTP